MALVDRRNGVCWYALGPFQVQNEVIVAVTLQLLESACCVLAVHEVDESEALAQAGVLVLRQVDTRDGTKRPEQLAQILLAGILTQVRDAQSGLIYESASALMETLALNMNSETRTTTPVIHAVTAGCAGCATRSTGATTGGLILARSARGEGLGAGIRRIEACGGQRALERALEGPVAQLAAVTAHDGREHGILGTALLDLLVLVLVCKNRTHRYAVLV